MRSILHSLAWKEWHEHKWKFASVAAILGGILAVSAFAVDNDALVIGFFLLSYAMVPLSVFLGASDAADERGRGTLHMLQSAPVSMWQNGFWKLVFGVSTCVVAIVLSLAAAVVSLHLFAGPEVIQTAERALARMQMPQFVDSGDLWVNCSLLAALIAIPVGVSFYLWTAAVGVNRKDQLRAGAAAIFVIVVWWSAIAFSSAAIDPSWLMTQGRPLVAVVFGISPGGFAIALLAEANREISQAWFMPSVVVAGVASHAALALWFVLRFGRTVENDNYSPATKHQSADAPLWIGPPRRSVLTAIVWKQFRESTPIALVGLAGIAAFFTATYLSYYATYADNQLAVVDLMSNLTMMIGFMVAIAVGIGVFDRDLGPKVNEFWRSRPIHPDLWYWAKYFVGLGVLLVVLYAPLLAAGGTLAGPFDEIGPNKGQMFYLHISVYAAALAAICIVRQPIYAAILGIATLLIGIGGVVFFFADWEQVQFEGALFAVQLGTAILATLVGWLAVRYDWGRKHG